jgi:beta-glucosidase
VELLETRCVLSSASYAASLYHVFLNRSPGPNEASGWIAALDSGVYPREIAAGFATSFEYASHRVTSAYETYLHREPDAGLNDWAAFVQTTLDPERMDARIIASTEYFQLHGSDNSSWLAAVYQDVLGRPLEPGGGSNWIQALRGGLSREEVAYRILKSPEQLTHFVTSAYENLLNRPPDPGGLGFWVVQMQNGMSSTQFLAAFTRSAEYIADQGGIDPVARSPLDQLSTTSISPAMLTDPAQQERELQNEVRLALGPAPIVFLGDSITDYFATRSGQPIWNSLMAPLGAVDFGIQGYLTSQVLGQVNAGEVAALAPRVAVLMIGTNNLGVGATPTATAEGIASIVDAIQATSPQTRILLLGILPRGFSPADPFRTLIAQTNAQIAPLADGRRVTYLDIGGLFVQPNGLISPSIMSDGLHPTTAGYQLLTLAIRPTLLALLTKPGPL